MERASYRVYTPRDLSSIPPSTLKSHRPRKGGLGWSGFFFLVVIGVMIGGSSYAALRVVKPDAHVTTAFGLGQDPVAAKPPETVVAAPAPAAPQPKPAEVTTTLTPMVAAPPVVDAKPVVKAASQRPISIASIPRRPLAPQPRTVTRPAPPTASAPVLPPAPALPPNPFDDQN